MTGARRSHSARASAASAPARRRRSRLSKSGEPLCGHHVGDGHRVRGIVFGIGARLLMMIVFMPMAGAGSFGMELGIMAPVMTLVPHVILGAVLGGGT